MATPDLAFFVVLVLNALWFAAGFQYFSFKPFAAAKLLVGRSDRGSPLFTTLAESGRFLGAMNGAFAAFALLLLLNHGLFTAPRQWALFATVFALAHGGQFAFNVRIALGATSTQGPLWPVLKGPMRFILVMDGVLMCANAVLAARF